jgi:hypothetical protein
LTADSSEATGLKFATPASGGGMTLLSTTTLSGATTTISSIDQTYNNLQMVITGITTSADYVLVVKPNNVGNLASTTVFENNDGSVSTSVLASDQMQGGSAASIENTDANNIFVWNFFNYASSTRYKAFQGTYGYARNTTGILTGGVSNGVFRSNTAISSFVLSPSSGTFSTGTVLLYGVK